jgi:hypothetical protein
VNLIRAEADEKGIAIETRGRSAGGRSHGRGQAPAGAPEFVKNAMESMENSGTLTLTAGRSSADG